MQVYVECRVGPVHEQDVLSPFDVKFNIDFVESIADNRR